MILHFISWKITSFECFHLGAIHYPKKSLHVLFKLSSGVDTCLV